LSSLKFDLICYSRGWWKIKLYKNLKKLKTPVEFHWFIFFQHLQNAKTFKKNSPTSQVKKKETLNQDHFFVNIQNQQVPTQPQLLILMVCFFNLKKKKENINKGWNFESPNIMQYNGLKGSLWSISIRGLVIVNVIMLVYEYVFYPYDAKSLLTGEKVE
jgi:hypothetical protein